jgi:hypothetical protein
MTTKIRIQALDGDVLVQLVDPKSHVRHGYPDITIFEGDEDIIAVHQGQVARISEIPRTVADPDYDE